MRGELDWIVMKALEKDRNRRYETANGLAADMRALPGRRAGAGVPAVGALQAPEVRAAVPIAVVLGGGVHCLAGAGHGDEPPGRHFEPRGRKG